MKKLTLLSSLAAVAAFAAATDSTAFAQTPPPAKANCAPPELLSSQPMERVNGGNVMSVTATINGSPERLLVDIGRTATKLWETPADKLHLTHEFGFSFDFAGRFSERSARVGQFTLGNLESGGFYISVAPNPTTADAPFDGILGNTIMWRRDVDLDFAHQKLNFFTTEKCEGAGIYWSPTTVTKVPIIAYTGMEYDARSPLPRLGQTYVPAILDGKVIIALLDTVADRTMLNPDVAKKLFGLSPDSMEAGSVDDGGTLIKAGIHTFSSLSLGGLTANNPHIAIPFDAKTQSDHMVHLGKTSQSSFYLHEIIPDMVIGMDLLKYSHLYMSFKNDRIYISAAGDGAALSETPTKTTWFNFE